MKKKTKEEFTTEFKRSLSRSYTEGIQKRKMKREKRKGKKGFAFFFLLSYFFFLFLFFLRVTPC